MVYPATAMVEVHHAGRWHRAGELRALGHDKVAFTYLEEYVFGDVNVPISLTLPVGLWPQAMADGMIGAQADYRPPSFLYDLVPQGRGRRFLLNRLQLSDSDAMVMPLVMAAAFNPIGCLRLDTAMDFYRQETVINPASSMAQGLSLSDITQRSDEFLELMALHAMLAAGTTGVQGVAPKFLLTTDQGGQWFADMALADAHAHEHWLVKLARGKSDDDRCVLRNEAAYLRVANAVGLYCQYEPVLHGEMLFLRRFDRQVQQGQVQRLHQESLASLIGQRGFGAVASQQSLLAGLRAVVDDPLAQTIEFIQRDVLNQALRNTDNHARNTAVQRLPGGQVQLTPVFDFAPMFKDPEMIPRSCIWRDRSGVKQAHWKQIIDQLDVPDHERDHIATALAGFASTVGNLETIARDCGVEAEVLNLCLHSIEAQATQLQALSVSTHG